MKINKFLIFSIFCCIIACNNIENNHLTIDLDKDTDSIYYSEFVKSLNYIKLNTNDSCLISDVKSIYMDEDTLCLLDRVELVYLFLHQQGN